MTGAAARRRDNTGFRFGHVDGPVLTAAVHHDDLSQSRLAEPCESGVDGAFFVERRDHDRDGHTGGSDGGILRAGLGVMNI